MNSLLPSGLEFGPVKSQPWSYENLEQIKMTVTKCLLEKKMKKEETHIKLNSTKSGQISECNFIFVPSQKRCTKSLSTNFFIGVKSKRTMILYKMLEMGRN